MVAKAEAGDKTMALARKGPMEAGAPQVIIGFAEALAAPEVTWSLIDGGFGVVAFTRRGAHPVLARSRHVRLHEITPPELSCQAALSDLEQFIASIREGTRS